MSYKTKCPVCDKPFKRRVQLSAGGGTIRVDDSEEVCVSVSYNRVCVH